MLKRELKFSTYLLPVMMVSFIPHIGYAVTAQEQIKASQNKLNLEQSDRTATLTSNSDQPASTADLAHVIETPPSAAVAPQAPTPLNIAVTKDANGALTAKLPNGQIVNFTGVVDPAKVAVQEKNTAESRSEEVPGNLDYSQASIIKGLTIKVDGNHAVLDGWIPNSCDGEYSVVNTDEASVLSKKRTEGVTYIGFSIVNKNGRFVSCMNDPRNNCDNDAVRCHHLSESQIPLVLDGKETYDVAYLNNHRTTGITPVNITGSVKIKSEEEIQNARALARTNANKKIEDENFKIISNCIKKTDDLDALSALVSDNLLDEGHRKTVVDKIMAEEKARQTKDNAKVITEIKALRKKADSSKTKLDDIDDLKANVYELAGKLDEMKEGDLITEKEYTKQQDILAGVVQKLIELRVSDDPNSEAFEDAKGMLDEALSGTSSKKDDDDSDVADGSGLHPSKKVLKELEAIYPILRRAKVSDQYMACMEDQYQLGGRRQTSATRDCKEAQKEFESESKALAKEYKGCLDKNGDDSKKRQKDKEFAAQCKEIEDEAQALQEVPSVDNAAIGNEYQAALKKANGGRSNSILGQNAPGAQNTLFAGAPQAPTFSNGGIPVVGAANGLTVPGAFGVNQYAYAPGATMMPGLTYPQSFNGYRGF